MTLDEAEIEAYTAAVDRSRDAYHDDHASRWCAVEWCTALAEPRWDVCAGHYMEGWR